MIKVSVIVPVYNVEKYLARCLDSIINQTLKEIEIIIINDGSCDNSLNICKEYAQKDFRIKIVSQENAGLAAARNTGLKHVKGEYIGFIDSDDWIDLDYFEKLYNTANEHNSDIALADFIRKGKNKHKVRMGLKKSEIAVNIYDKINLCQNLRLGCVWNKIYRSEFIFKHNLTFPEGRLFEDGIFSMQAIYYANSVVSTPNTYYYYFVNPASIVKSAKTQKKIDDVIICQHEILNFLSSKNIDLQPEQFLTVTYKMQLLFLTLLVVKEDWFLKKYFLFGSLPVLTIKKGAKDRIIGNCLGIKFTIREKQYTYKKIIELNRPYETGASLTPHVINAEETLQELIHSDKSICRFGDGEFNLIRGESIPFQTYTPKLQERLKEILISKENILVGIPDIFGYLSKNQIFWRKFAVYNREKIYPYLDFSKTYYDALITRVYIANKDKKHSKNVFDNFKLVWNNKNVVFVEGEGSRLGFGNDLFDNTETIQRVICPAINAFSQYDEILKICLELGKDKLFILALGPTATVLAYDLANAGYRALDLGHLDIEYEWFLMGAKKKIPVKNKYINETRKGRIVTDLKDKEYLSQIYRSVL